MKNLKQVKPYDLNKFSNDQLLDYCLFFMDNQNTRLAISILKNRKQYNKIYNILEYYCNQLLEYKQKEYENNGIPLF